MVAGAGGDTVRAMKPSLAVPAVGGASRAWRAPIARLLPPARGKRESFPKLAADLQDFVDSVEEGVHNDRIEDDAPVSLGHGQSLFRRPDRFAETFAG